MVRNAERIMVELQKRLFVQVCQQYSATIIDHWMRPRNPRIMTIPDGHAKIKGTSGDTMEIFIRVAENIITEASFMSDNCMASVITASMAVEMASGKPIMEALTITQKNILDALEGMPKIGEHYALLAVNTLRAAINDFLQSHNEP